MADTTVKYITSLPAPSISPVLSGTAGALVALLNAVLVDGYGLQTVDSVAISGGIATVTRAAGHPFEVDAVALISGATVGSGTINGEQKVLSVTATAYTFATAATGSVTGTVQHKVAPLGWTRPFTGSSTVQVYRSPDTAGTQCYLRVDDTGTTTARVVGYETMSDVNTGAGPFPTSTQVSGGAFWQKSSTADSTARTWAVVGDQRGFGLHVATSSAVASRNTVWFGDVASKKSPDPWACLITGDTGAYSGATSTADITYSESSATKAWMPRDVTGLGSAVSPIRTAMSPTNLSTVYSGSGGLTYPNRSDNGVYVCQIAVVDTNAWRATVPGIYYCPMNIGTATYTLGNKLPTVTGLTGRTLRALPNSAGVGFADVTGPWR